MDILVGLGCALAWALGSISMRNLSHKLDPFTLNAPRATAGAVAIWAILCFRGQMPDVATLLTQQDLMRLAMLIGSMWVGGGIGDAMYVGAIRRMGVSRAYPISNAYPAITLVLGILLLNETATPGIIAGMVLTIAGVVFISRERQAPANPTDTSHIAQGVGLSFGAAIMWAISAIMLSSASSGLDCTVVATVRLTALVLLLWIIVLARKSWSPLRALSLREWGVLVGGGGIGWGAGSLMFVMSVAALGPTRATVITSTAPLLALPMNVALLHEKITWRVIVGTLLTVAGVTLIA